MKYIKAKFLKGDKPVGRSYTYKAPIDATVGDILQNVNGTKLVITEDEVSEEWVDAYGEQNIAILNRIKES